MYHILFFTDNSWAFGREYRELGKELYPEFLSELLDWDIDYSLEEFSLIAEHHDLLVSNPHGCAIMREKYKIRPSKLFAICHGEYEIIEAVERLKSQDMFNDMAGYAVTSPYLVQISISYGVPRIPTVLLEGIVCERYQFRKRDKISALGYCGTNKFDAWYWREKTFDCKRVYLAEQVSNACNLPLIRPEKRLHHLAMFRYYQRFDLLIFCSLLEGGPCPAKEAMACGIPVIGTPCGLFPQYISKGGGFIVPFEEKEYVKEAIEIIERLRANSDEYEKAQFSAFNSMKNWDWAKLAPSWKAAFRKALET